MWGKRDHQITIGSAPTVYLWARVYWETLYALPKGLTDCAEGKCGLNKIPLSNNADLPILLREWRLHLLRPQLIIPERRLPSGQPFCDDPRSSYRRQVVRVGAPGPMGAGKRKDQRRQCQRTEDQQHQPQKAGCQNVQHTQYDGHARQDECDPGEHRPEGWTEGHPFGNHWNHCPDGGQMGEAEIDRAQPECPTNQPGRWRRK